MNKPKNDGKFRPGPDPHRTGRPPGSKNKIAPELARALVIAATRHGYDGQGEGGLNGYLRMLRDAYGMDLSYLQPSPPPGRPLNRLNGNSPRATS